LSRDVAVRAGNGAIGDEARERGAISGCRIHYQAGVHVCSVDYHISDQKKQHL